MGGENVSIEEHAKEIRIDAKDWPSGDAFIAILSKANISIEHNPQASNPAYWQASARYSLLKHYELLGPTLEALNPYQMVEGKKQLVLSESNIKDIRERWIQIIEDSSFNNDLKDLLASGKSNKRTLMWSTMECNPGCQFNLHAHPNLELVYCARGELHEVRMKGEPLGTDFEVCKDGSGNGIKVRGPNLTSLQRPWYFDTLSEGKWLVNEVGSVHKSFTATAGNGCTLVVLWGGSHANIDSGEEPRAVNVQAAVTDMDATLQQCDCIDWETIQQTFLPESERSKS